MGVGLRQHRPPRSGQKQSGYESETPKTGLGFASKASRIFAKTTSMPRQRQPIVKASAPHSPQSGTKGSSGGQSVTESATCENRSRPPAKGERGSSAERRDVRPWLTPSCAPIRAAGPSRDRSERPGLKTSRNRRRRES